jgi:hypothetical protein
MSLPDLGILRSKSTKQLPHVSQILEFYNIKLVPTCKFQWSDFCPNKFTGTLSFFWIQLTWSSQVNGPRGCAHISPHSAWSPSFQQSAYTLNPSKYHSTRPMWWCLFVLYSSKNLKIQHFWIRLVVCSKTSKGNATRVMSACLFSTFQKISKFSTSEYGLLYVPKHQKETQRESCRPVVL